MSAKFDDNLPHFSDTQNVVEWAGLVEDYLGGEASHISNLASGIASESSIYAKEYDANDQAAMTKLIKEVDSLVDEASNIFQAQEVLDALNSVPKTGTDQFNDAIYDFKNKIETIKQDVNLTDIVPT